MKVNVKATNCCLSCAVLQDVIVEAATELAIDGVVDLPVDNQWNGVDLVVPGYWESAPYVRGLISTIKNGVRITLEDEYIHIYKFENFGVSARFDLNWSSLPSSLLVSIVKEML